MKKPTFTVRGRFLKCLNNNSFGTQTLIDAKNFTYTISQNSNQNATASKQIFDWENALIDASITSAITFFSALGGEAVAGIESITIIESATIAALSQFFIFLALKRGLIQSNNAQ